MKEYAGQFESFLFSSIRSSFHVYKPTSINPKDFKKDDKNFEVGPAQSTRPNSRDLAPAQPMCPKIIIDHKKAANALDEFVKRNTQPR